MATALTSKEILKKLNLSRSTFYYLLKNNLVSLPTTETGRYVWDDSVIDEITKALSNKTIEVSFNKGHDSQSFKGHHICVVGWFY